MGAAERGWGSGYPNCQSSRQERITVHGVSVTCRREIAPLVARAMVETRETGYILDQSQTGAYVCRPIGGTSIPSNHSWGLAVDLNWRENPFTYDANAKRSITPAVVAIWKKYGFSWGGDWQHKKDFMHFEYLGTPGDAARQVDALKSPDNTPPPPVGANQCPEMHPTIKEGARGRSVNHLQYFLIRSGANIAGDGSFGPATKNAVRNHQTWLRDYKREDIVVDGVVGPKTWQAMHNWADGMKI